MSGWRSFFLCALLPAFAGAAPAPPEQNPPASTAPAASAERPQQPLTPDQLYETGKALFDQYAPPEIKEQYEFPSREQWDEFAAKLQRALDSNSFEELTEYEPQARAALAALRALPGYEDYANWLEERLDLIQAAKLAGQLSPPKPAPPLPYYDLWQQRLRDRPVPPQAAALLPMVRAAFAAEGVPVELVWLAEVESMFNPNARSPAGAKGLYQLMPDTARALGLSTWLPDDRANPEKSAHAAARRLRSLYEKFGDWPLALAAYNAGEGRVSRALVAQKATTFSGIVRTLPVETRLYVPKVCATVALRTGVSPEEIAAPKGDAGNGDFQNDQPRISRRRANQDQDHRPDAQTSGRRPQKRRRRRQSRRRPSQGVGQTRQTRR